MKDGRCIIHELAQIISADPSLKAVWLDSAKKKVSFAFQDGVETTECRRHLEEVVSKYKPDPNSKCVDPWQIDCELCDRGTSQPMPPNIKIITIPDAGVLLEKEIVCPVIPFRWQEFRWAHIKPRQIMLPSELTSLTEWKQELLSAIICGALTFIGLILEKNIFGATNAASIYFYVMAYAAGAWFPAKDVAELLHKRILDIHFLMLCVAAGAAVIGHWCEGASLLFLFSLSGALEEMAMANTEREIKSLFKTAPKTAVVVSEKGIENSVPVDTLNIGMILRVRPGELFPVDAEVISGTSAVNESNLTGEALPIDKKIGDTVFSGTLNLWGSVDCKVIKPASESVLSKIIRLIEEAQESKAPSQKFTDKFSTGYTYLILGASFIMFFVWWVGMDVPAFVAPAGESSAFYRAMTLLVVASPCALVLSIPSAILAGIAAGAKHGILFRGGAAIEKLSEVTRVALDKTGTLTTGDLEVTFIRSIPPGREEEVLRIAASIGHHSTHPVSRAIAKYSRKSKIPLLPVQDFKSLTGMGVSGFIQEVNSTQKVHALIGRRMVFQQRDWVGNFELPKFGITETLVECGDLRGQILLADQIRDVSAPLLKKLQDRKLKVTMLTGDRQEAAELIASQLNLKDVRFGLSPNDKVEIIKQWTKDGEKVAMVGDGVNDAPSLAASYVAVGMGVRGSDAVLEQADVVLMQDKLENFLYAVQLSKKAKTIINQNLIISLGVIILLVVSAFFSVLPLTIGVIGHEGSTVVVVLNSLRLLIEKNES